jgi:hypothetical protein
LLKNDSLGVFIPSEELRQVHNQKR